MQAWKGICVLEMEVGVQTLTPTTEVFLKGGHNWPLLQLVIGVNKF